jgi:hypothetical protein
LNSRSTWPIACPFLGHSNSLTSRFWGKNIAACFCHRTFWPKNITDRIYPYDWPTVAAGSKTGYRSRETSSSFFSRLQRALSNTRTYNIAIRTVALSSIGRVLRSIRQGQTITHLWDCEVKGLPVTSRQSCHSIPKGSLLVSAFQSAFEGWCSLQWRWIAQIHGRHHVSTRPLI